MATIREVAALAGVSLSTVSIVINGQAAERKITDATCKKVWDAVEQLGYHPNIAARKLRVPDSGTLTIALYWSNDFRTALLGRFLQGMQRELSARPDIELVVVTYPPEFPQGGAAVPRGDYRKRLGGGPRLSGGTEVPLPGGPV